MSDRYSDTSHNVAGRNTATLFSRAARWLFVSALIATTAVVVTSWLSVRPANAASANGQLQIMAWGGNISPKWQQKLHVSAIRIACSDAPNSCMRYVQSLNPAMHIYLAILLKPGTQDYGAQYSALSLQDPALKEVGLDDFISQYWKLYRGGVSNPPSFLGAFIDGLKSRNPRLKFGATIYEDDLGGQYLNDQHLPPALRAKFDVIHFFIHYRGDSANYDRYIQQLKTLFPNAELTAGVYDYDRISYVPCVIKGQPCSTDQEMSDFNEQLTAAMSLLKNGTVSWMELFPSAFGQEANWHGWSEPRICPGRRGDCVANTEKMDKLASDRIAQMFE